MHLKLFVMFTYFTFKKATAGFTLILVFVAVLFSGTQAIAQKSGLIYQQPATGKAGRTILDPNNDGYISASNAGFQTASDLTESEIKYKPIPQLTSEPNSDVATGPNCGFTDFVDDGGQYAAGVFYDGTNFLFRFRLAGTANNSKGYSILIDTDQKMGAYGQHQDPNYTPGNPGFEIEVVLQTNFGVYLYDVDGSTTPTQKGSVLAYADYSQKAVAENIYAGAACPNKYFYDFYIPVADIIASFPTFSASLPLRFVANTVIAPKSVLQGPISDIQGLDDKTYANSDLAWTAAIQNIYPTPLNQLNSTTTTTFGSNPLDRTTNIPTQNAITVNTTSASVTVGAGGVIKVYKVGVSTPVCSITVLVAGTHTLTGCTTFINGDQVYATLTEIGKSESASSNTVLVRGCTNALSVSPTIDTKTTQGEKGLTGTCVAGATIKLYNNGVLYTTFTSATAAWTYDFCTTTGYNQSCIPCGTWTATATTGTKCESMPSLPFCWSSTKNACLQTFTSTADPIINDVAAIYNTDKVITGTSVANATIYFYINRLLTKTVTATGTSWSVDGLALNTNDTISVSALDPVGNKCLSAASVTAIVKQVKLIAPFVTSPILAGASSVSGSSVEPNGTTITVYRNRAGNITTVGSQVLVTDNKWSVTGLGNTILAATDIVYAVASATGKTTSDNSNNITVGGGVDGATTTLDNSTYNAGTNLVSGKITSAVNGQIYTVILYLDGYAIDTFTSAAAVGGTATWSRNTLSTTVGKHDYLYSGGDLTARSFRSGTTTEGAVSTTAYVISTSPTVQSFTSTAAIYHNTPIKDSIILNSSQVGVVYTITNSTGTTVLGNSKVGTGSAITLYHTLTTSQTLYVKAEKVGEDAAPTMSTNSKTVNVDKEAVYTNNTATKGTNTYSDGETLASVTDADGAITASVTAGTLPSWMLLNASTGTITVPNAQLIVPSNTAYTFSVTTTHKAADGVTNFTTVTPLSMTFADANVPTPSQKTWSNTTHYLDNAGTVGVTVSSSQSGVTYSLVNSLGASRGSSAPGNGGTVNLTSTSISSDEVLYVKAANSVNSINLTGSKSVIVDKEAVYTNNTTGKVGTYTDGETVASVTDADGSITSAVVSAGTLPTWLNLNATNGTITVPEAHKIVPGTYTYTITTARTENNNTFTTATPMSMTFNAPSVPLPVEFISFEGELTNGKVELEWATAMELNNNYYSIERSANGITFEKIGTQEGAGNSNHILNYSFTDEQPLNGISYYRIKQTDFNGDFDYSKTIAIRNTNESKGISSVEVYPNPVTDGRIRISMPSNTKDESAIVSIFDMSGRKVACELLVLTNGNTMLNLNGLGGKVLQAGIYTMLIDSNSGTYKAKVVIK